MFFPRRFRAPSFNDAVSFFYFCSHVGQFVGRFVSSYPGVRFDVSYTNVLPALQLQLSVRRSQPDCQQSVGAAFAPAHNF